MSIIFDNNIKQAGRNGFPIITGYFFVSFVFGLTAVSQGLPIWCPILLSLIVYAGAAQFTFLALIASNASTLTIVLTTFLINLRHMLMSVYMSNILDNIKISTKLRLWYGFGLTDESFAVHSMMANNEQLNAKFLISFNTFCHIAWVLGSILGALISTLSENIIDLKLEYALTAMMLYVLISLINTREKLFVAIISIISMSILSLAYESYLNIFIATAIGCAFILWKKNKV